ncbi:MAG: cytochrome c [Gammaproteobacteria bacterium]|nr:cytochrome c [Gammaproteobacteria bacterium]MDH4255988.1 cytochrome c [Gammaproteobacteria bacterium]MDH5311759.1 cytochrome c [Gammaproteobacteria bacterium]
MNPKILRLQRLARGVAPAFLLVAALGHAGDAERGAVVYYEHGCYGCHGFGGAGRTPLVNGVSGMLVSEDVFLAFLRQREDQNPVLPANSMPNYGVYALSDDDALAVYAYVRTLVDTPPEIDEIPAFLTILEASDRAYDEDEEHP